MPVKSLGKGERGRKFAQALYCYLGVTELKDQLTALDQVLPQVPQLDGSRVGWWGWAGRSRGMRGAGRGAV